MSVSTGIPSLDLHPRVLAQFGGTKGANSQLKNIHRFPCVIRRFHLMTARALSVLDKDPFLLNRLEIHLRINSELKPELGRDLMSKGLVIEGFGKNPTLIYGLRGTSAEEIVAFNRLVKDLAENPTIEDLAVIFEAQDIRLELDSGIELNSIQIKILYSILNQKSKGPSSTAKSYLELLKEKQVGGILITPEREGSISIEQINEIPTLIIPVELLGQPKLLEIIFATTSHISPYK